MPTLNPTAKRAAKIALVSAVPFLFLAGAVAPEDIGDLLDLLAVFAGVGAGVLHLGRPPTNLREAVQESVELAEQAILHQDATPAAAEAEAATKPASYQAKHAAEDLQLPETAAKAHQAAQQATAQAVGAITGAVTALVAALRARR